MNDELQLPEMTIAAIAGCKVAHARLFASLETIDDVVLARPSRLPSWTIGHVLSHLARNADSFVRILEAAEVGETVSQYPSAAQRNADIESGATRSAAACVNDVRRACQRLEQAFAQATPAAWRGGGTWLDGRPIACIALPASRWREVEIHHTDLGTGYEISDWPPDFVTAALPDVLAALPSRVSDPAERAAVLAWIVGRKDSPGHVEFAQY